MIYEHLRRFSNTRRERKRWTCILDLRKNDTIRDKRYEKNPVERSSALKLIPETVKNKKEKGKEKKGEKMHCHV